MINKTCAFDYSKEKHGFAFKLDLAKIAGHCMNCGVDIKADSLCLQSSKASPAKTTNMTCVNCKVCPDFHKLGYVYDLRVKPEGIYQYNQFNCDVCSITKTIVTRVLHCPGCEFDICNECEKKIFNFEVL